MKALNVIAWITGSAAGLIIILAFLSLVLRLQLFGVRHVINYFHVANSLLLVAICCLVYIRNTADRKS